jgi:hypothetical protein
MRLTAASIDRQGALSTGWRARVDAANVVAIRIAGIAVDTDFAATRFVFVAWTETRPDGSSTLQSSPIAHPIVRLLPSDVARDRRRRRTYRADRVHR